MTSQAQFAAAACVFALVSGGASPQPHAVAVDERPKAVDIKLEDARWTPMFPNLGDRSPEIAFLREDPKTHATQLLIKITRNFHVTKHWHSANETHTILTGAFILECEGRADTLRAGGFNYMPSRMIHEAWTLPNEGALLFITVDGKWDVNFVAGLPTPRELEKGDAAGP